jgi:hypothetical protein
VNPLDLAMSVVLRKVNPKTTAKQKKFEPNSSEARTIKIVTFTVGDAVFEDEQYPGLQVNVKRYPNRDDVKRLDYVSPLKITINPYLFRCMFAHLRKRAFSAMERQLRLKHTSKSITAFQTVFVSIANWASVGRLNL